MHPTIGYDMANARITDMRQQAQRDALARAARRRGDRTRARPTMGGGARCQALFASGVQSSDALGPDTVAEAIGATAQQFGTRGCASRMAQEYGEHPEAVAERMRWARSLPGLATRHRSQTLP